MLERETSIRDTIQIHLTVHVWHQLIQCEPPMFKVQGSLLSFNFYNEALSVTTVANNYTSFKHNKR